MKHCKDGSCSTSPPSLHSGLFSFPLYYFSLYFFLHPFLFVLPFSCPLLPSHFQPCPLVSAPLSSSYLHHLSLPFPVLCFMHLSCAFLGHNSSSTCCIWALANPELQFTLRVAQCSISQKAALLLYIQVWTVHTHFSCSVVYMENKPKRCNFDLFIEFWCCEFIHTGYYRNQTEP